jgi:hypothetical protein
MPPGGPVNKGALTGGLPSGQHERLQPYQMIYNSQNSLPKAAITSSSPGRYASAKLQEILFA